jgi:hypothetical protein
VKVDFALPNLQRLATFIEGDYLRTEGAGVELTGGVNVMDGGHHMVDSLEIH